MGRKSSIVLACAAWMLIVVALVAYVSRVDALVPVFSIGMVSSIAVAAVGCIFSVISAVAGARRWPIVLVVNVLAIGLVVYFMAAG